MEADRTGCRKHGWAVAATLVVAVGCGGPYDATVSGVVTLDGTPLGRGQVAFYPTSAGPPGIGRIDESGRYEINTGREAGLPSGQYDVTVIANEPPEKSEGERGGPPPAGKLITPAWYKTRQHSNLSVTVEPGDNEIDLELSSTPPPDWSPPKGRRRSN